MTTSSGSSRRRLRQPCPHNKSPYGTSYICIFATLLTVSIGRCQETDEIIDYGNHNLEWEDGPASWEEFGHDNDPSVCGLPVLTVEEWEEGRYWEGNKPVLVKNVTDGWAALKNWRLQEMLRLYPDAEATMGDCRKVGESGPDAAGNLLSPTTVKVREQYMCVCAFF